MNELLHDQKLDWLLGGIYGTLLIATLAGALIARKHEGDVVDNLIARIRGWWLIIGVFTLFMLAGTGGIIVLFAIVSFLALREFITLGDTGRSDHKALIWVFFVFTPAQYVFVALGWFEPVTLAIPLVAFIVIATRNAMVGNTEGFLERTAIVHWSLLACTYCVSYIPALLVLDIPDFGGQVKLLLFFMLVVQLSDVLQYCCGKLMGKRQISPVSPNKTWEGLIGGVIGVTGVGAALWWATPFTPLEAAGIAFVVAVLGFLGGLVMSAIKRDRGVKDYGAIIAGHGGVLDRIDSLIFAAPVFFHIVRYKFT